MSSYARLFITDMLPAECRKALCLDADTLGVDNLGNLYDIDLGEYYAAGVIDTASDAIKEKTGTKAEESFVNAAGVLLINLEKWREEDILHEFLSYIGSCNGAVFYHDQGVINQVLAGKILVLNSRDSAITPYFSMKQKTSTRFYKVSELYYTAEEISAAEVNTAIIYFTESFMTRPWMKVRSIRILMDIFRCYQFRHGAKLN